MRTIPRDSFHLTVTRSPLATPTPTHRTLVGELATRQHGVVTRADLVQLGIPKVTVLRWLADGYLRPVHRAVFAVGHGDLSFAGRCAAAVLACGPNARLTGAALAYLHGAIRYAPNRIDVVTTDRRRVRLDGVRVRHARHIRGDERSTWNGIRCVTTARMLVDMADRTGATELAAVMHELAFIGELRLSSLRRCITRYRTRRGPTHRRISDALDLHESGSAGTQSRFERDCLDYLLELGVPMPRITPAIEVDGHVVRPDFDWPGLGVCCEADGPGHERRRTAADDARKTALLEQTGRTVLRIRQRYAARDRAAVTAWFRERGLLRT